jgi:5-methylcytosine-specific restriction endonuclease McrA
MSPEQGSFFVNNARLKTPQSEFLDLTRSRYDAMVRRFAERRNERGRVIRVGFPIPFSLAEYREWILHRLNGRVSGLATCNYCGFDRLTIHLLVTDHRVSPSRGGDLGLENLTVSCDACNQQKGGMSDIAFKALLHFSNQLPTIDRTDLLGRLQRATRLAIQLRRSHAQAAKAQQQADADFDAPLNPDQLIGEVRFSKSSGKRYKGSGQKVRIVPHQPHRDAPTGH